MYIMIQKVALMTVFSLSLFIGRAQKTKTSSEIMDGLQKLNVLGSVLYIAAHPDDENTRLITQLSKGMHLRTAYLSLTRGDGGQNLIGSELDEYLGAIRTQELVEARKIDGGIQFFSRANDFGYSKNAEETFSIWQRDSLLADVLRVIRLFKPDVIINRFDHRTSGKTHGHHTASAMLGMDGFKYCNSPLFMRSVLAESEAHLVQRIFFNTSYFFYGREKFDTMDKSFLYSMDVGSFYPTYGFSNNEIAAASRSMHKSQGFGINSSRGSMIEYLERLDAKKEIGHESPFEGLDFSWTRLNGGGNVKNVIEEAISKFEYQRPWTIIPLLQKAEQYIKDLPPGHWKSIKLEEVQSLIMDCAGIFAESYTEQQTISRHASIPIYSEFIVRNPVPLVLERIQFPFAMTDSLILKSAIPNQAYMFKSILPLDSSLSLTSPFWMLNGRLDSHYPVSLSSHCYLPTAPKQVQVVYSFSLNGISYSIARDVIYKNDDPVLGEVKSPLDLMPDVAMVADDQLYIQKGNALVCQLQFISFSGTGKLKVSLQLPAEFHSKTNEQWISFDQPGQKQTIAFELSATQKLNKCINIPVLINDVPALVYHPIQYPHISKQNVLVPAKIRIVSADIACKAKRIAYVEGAGDYTDDALKLMGHAVTIVPAEELNQISRKRFDVVVFGIRALNVNPALAQCKKILDSFTQQGGKVIMQYNTTSELVTTDFAIAPLKIGRGRVTNERSEVQLLQPNHAIFRSPNQIDSTDFQGWTQERGLYYPTQYDSSYVELLSMNDPGEPALKSGILYLQNGKGSYIYTSLAWFRQLKAGVPGAFRLFSNLISSE